MKRFLKKILVFTLIYLGLCRIISIGLPYHWGNPWYSVKINYLKNNKTQQFNTYFFGSSRVYRQINPSLFDSLAHQFTKAEIHSFNLGAPRTFVPQSYYLYERFLDSKLSSGAKYCFLELGKVAAIQDHQMHQAASNYWLGFSDLRLALRSILLDDTQTTTHKSTQIGRYLTSYLENVMHLGHFSQQITTKHYYDESYLGPSSDGYLPLVYDLANTQNPDLKNRLSFRKRNLENAPERLEQRKALVQEAYNDHSNTFYDKVLEKKIHELMEKSKKKGITLVVLFISLNPEDNLKQLINLYHRLPASNRINLTNPNEYPEFLELENAFDIGHLNTKGSRLFTTHLAKKFQEIKVDR